ncbi:MAG: Hsp20/alpha crystallin family protein [Balneolales bacterium]
MTLVKFRSDADYPAIPRHFNEAVDKFFKDSLTMGNHTGFTPSTDIAEDEKQFIIQLAIPGINKDDIDININNRTLTISGERRHKKEDKSVKYHLIESRFGKFERSFTLPDNVELDSVDAKYEDGLLKVSVQKSENKQIKQIKVK